MAAAFITARKQPRPLNPNVKPQEMPTDRDEELQAVINCKDVHVQIEHNCFSDGPVSVSPEILMGKMPKPDK